MRCVFLRLGRRGLGGRGLGRHGGGSDTAFGGKMTHGTLEEVPCADRTKRVRSGVSCNAEAVHKRHLVGHIPVSRRGLVPGGRLVVSPPSDHARATGRGSRRIGRRTRRVVGARVPIVHPLGDIPCHVVQPERIRRLLAEGRGQRREQKGQRCTGKTELALERSDEGFPESPRPVRHGRDDAIGRIPTGSMVLMDSPVNTRNEWP